MDAPLLDTDNPMLHRSQERIERHVRNLQELAEIGMTLARAVGQQVMAKELARQIPEMAPPEVGLRDLGMVFDRVSRAVRQTMAMESHVDEERRSLEAFVKTEAANRDAAALVAYRRRRAAQVKTIVGDAITARKSGEARENLLFDLSSNLRNETYMTNFCQLPLDQAVARICRDLGFKLPAGLGAGVVWADEAPPVPVVKTGAGQAGMEDQRFQAIWEAVRRDPRAIGHPAFAGPNGTGPNGTGPPRH